VDFVLSVARNLFASFHAVAVHKSSITTKPTKKEVQLSVPLYRFN